MREPVRLGVDIGGTSVKAAVFVGDDCVRTGQSAFYARPDAAVLQDAVRAAVGSVDRVDAAGRVDTIGLCVPGLMNPSRTQVVLSVNVPGLAGIPLARLVPDALGLSASPPTHVLNDAVATGLDLQRARRLDGRVLVMALGTGIGAAVLDDGVSLDADDGTPGHWGQLDVGPFGPPVYGPDGAAGTLESYIGVPALRRVYGPDVSAALPTLTGTEPAIQALVRALRIAHALYRPQHVCLCGGVGTRLRHLLPTIERAVRDRLTGVARPDWTLTCGDDDYHAARGAARAATD